MVVLGDGWRRDALEPIAGLTLLGRAVLSLCDAGVRLIAVVGSSPEAADPMLIDKALAGRRPDVRIVHFHDSEQASTEIALAFGVAAATLAVVIPEPVVVGPTPEAHVEIRPLTDLSILMSSSRRGASFDPQCRNELENRLFEEIRKSIESDGVVAYFLVRPVSNWITRRLWHLPVSPNQVSVAALVVGVAAGPVVAIGGRAASIAAALMLVINLLLDCVDGELARLTHRKSRLGQWLDTIGDDASLLSYLIGLGLSVGWLPLGLHPLMIASAAGALFAATSAYVYYVLIHEIGTIDTALFPHTVGRQSVVTYAFKRDFIIALFLAMAVSGLEWVSLLLIATGAVTHALAVLGTAVTPARRVRAAK